MPRVKYTCIVCGRVFPEGQGIVLKHGDLLLTFHSSRCVSRFLKRLLDNTPYEEIGRFVKNVYEEFIEEAKKRRESRVKKI